MAPWQAGILSTDIIGAEAGRYLGWPTIVGVYYQAPQVGQKDHHHGDALGIGGKAEKVQVTSACTVAELNTVLWRYLWRHCPREIRLAYLQ